MKFGIVVKNLKNFGLDSRQKLRCVVLKVYNALVAPANQKSFIFGNFIIIL